MSVSLEYVLLTPFPAIQHVPLIKLKIVSVAEKQPYIKGKLPISESSECTIAFHPQSLVAPLLTRPVIPKAGVGTHSGVMKLQGGPKNIF